MQGVRLEGGRSHDTQRVGIADVMEFENISPGTKAKLLTKSLNKQQMQNCKTSAGTAAKKSFKSSLLQRPAIILAMLLLAAVLSSCGGVAIDQTVKETSCLNKTSRIITNVVIKDWMGGYKTIEYQTWLVVPNDKVDSVKKAEYDKALPFLEAARNCR